MYSKPLSVPGIGGKPRSLSGMAKFVPELRTKAARVLIFVAFASMSTRYCSNTLPLFGSTSVSACASPFKANEGGSASLEAVSAGDRDRICWTAF